VKLSAHRAGPFDRAHGPEHAEWASREGFIIHIVPLDPAYSALGGTGPLPVKEEIYEKGKGDKRERVEI
jgi:hypothetical protein